MKTFFAVSIALSCFAYGLNTKAACTNYPTLQSSSSFPKTLQGKLVYHSYTNYNDGSSNLFLKDFSTQEVKQLNEVNWNIEDPMNAHFSPNGHWLTFMGKQNDHWNIFIWQLNSPLPPVNLSQNTPLNNSTSEDPKFSPDGNYIVYKKNGDLGLMHLNFTNPDQPYPDKKWLLTRNGYSPEESMPYFSSDSTTIYYSQGAKANSDIYRLPIKIGINLVNTGRPILVAGRTNLAEYYPITQNNNLFFVGWKDASRIDLIYKNEFLNSQPVALPLNDCNADNSDPMMADSTYMFFSSTRNNAVYKLYVGDINTGDVWPLDLDAAYVTKHQLGATYTNYTK